LAFYAKILQQYGIDVVSASIVPIKTEYEYEDSKNEIGIKDNHTRDVHQDKTILVPDVLSGRYSSMAKEVFPNDFSINGSGLTS
jgi:hypothetical protein